MKCEYCGRVLTPGATQCPGCGAPIEQNEEKVQQEEQQTQQQAQQQTYEVPPVTPVYSGPSYTGNRSVEYGGFWIRVLAFIIDYIVMGLLCATYIGIPVAMVYMPVCEAFWNGATVGKKAMGLKVVNTYYEKITIWQAIGRYFAKILSYAICCFGFFMIGFTEKKQGLHDRMAGTYIIKAK